LPTNLSLANDDAECDALVSAMGRIFQRFAPLFPDRP
jgi:hypothetical protein